MLVEAVSKDHPYSQSHSHSIRQKQTVVSALNTPATTSTTQPASADIIPVSPAEDSEHCSAVEMDHSDPDYNPSESDLNSDSSCSDTEELAVHRQTLYRPMLPNSENLLCLSLP